MTAAVICLAIALALSAGGLVTIVLVGRDLIDRVSTAQDAERAQGLAQIAQEQSMHTAERARDESIEKATALEAQVAPLRSQLAETQRQLNVASAHMVKELKTKVVTATPQQLLDMVQERLNAK